MTNEENTADVRIRNWTLATGTKPGARHERGLFDTRPRDAISFGVASGYFSNELQRAQRSGRLLGPDGGVRDHETVVELTYRFDLREGAYFIQPDFQYIIEPGGTGHLKNALVFGAQFGINFSESTGRS